MTPNASCNTIHVFQTLTNNRGNPKHPTSDLQLLLKQQHCKWLVVLRIFQIGQSHDQSQSWQTSADDDVSKKRGQCGKRVATICSICQGFLAGLHLMMVELTRTRRRCQSCWVRTSMQLAAFHWFVCHSSRRIKSYRMMPVVHHFRQAMDPIYKICERRLLLSSFFLCH